MQLLLNRLHSLAVRLVYLVLAPRHPRWRTDVHAVLEDDSSQTLWVHTHGLERWHLPNIEFVGVPDALAGYAHGILLDLMGYMKFEKAIGPNEHFGGLLVARDQRVVHYATARLVQRPTDPPHDGFLRFVDHGEPADSGFPRRLFATHIGALGETHRSTAAREKLFRQALAVYPGTDTEWATSSDFGTNPGNWLAFDGLGNALCDRGATEEGINYLREAVKRCPAAALRTREIVEEGVRTGHLPPPEIDPRCAFWLALDPERLRGSTPESDPKDGLAV